MKVGRQKFCGTSDAPSFPRKQESSYLKSHLDSRFRGNDGGRRTLAA
jgi:hypothetical protein